jgi:hypothetical protein
LLRQQWLRVAVVVVVVVVVVATVVVAAAAGCTVVVVRWAAAAVSEGVRWAAGFAVRRLAAPAFGMLRLASVGLTEAITLPGVAADDLLVAVIATGTVEV